MYSRPELRVAQREAADGDGADVAQQHPALHVHHHHVAHPAVAPPHHGDGVVAHLGAGDRGNGRGQGQRAGSGAEGRGQGQRAGVGAEVRVRVRGRGKGQGQRAEGRVRGQAQGQGQGIAGVSMVEASWCSWHLLRYGCA